MKSQYSITVKAREKEVKRQDKCDHGVVGSVVASVQETLSPGIVEKGPFYQQDSLPGHSLRSFFLVTQLALPSTIHLFFIILSYNLSFIY